MNGVPSDPSAANPFPVLRTPRLVLRQITADDAADLFAFRSDPLVQRYNGGPMLELSESAQLIDDLQSGFESKTMIHWGVTLANEGVVIGLFGLANWSHEHRRAEIGFSLHRNYWKQGIAFEAAREIISFGFQDLSLNRIHACPWAENTASVALLQKCNFRLEGTLRDEFFADDTFHDELLYGLLLSEYQP